MLTISQLATYAGTTVRAVRHYHSIGLLSEPQRDASGYRRYDAAAVVRLIRIRTLAAAGVPLSRMQELLDASHEEFASGIQEIDRQLGAEIRRLQTSRERINLLAAGDNLALPDSVVAYLDRLRGVGVDERYIEMERDAWILIAPQVPQTIDSMIAKKQEELDDPHTVELYRLLSEAIDWPVDDPRIVKVADLLEHLMIRGVEAGEIGIDELDGPLVDLLDATTASSAPAAKGLLAILEERGWKGWTRLEQVPDAVNPRTPPSPSTT